MARNSYFKLAGWFGAAMAIFFVIGLVTNPPVGSFGPEPESRGTDLSVYALLVSAGGFFVSLVGTASTIILGWRADRRQQRELASKLATQKHSYDT
jgi:hypothetical protein